MKKRGQQHIRPVVLLLLVLSTTQCLERCGQAPHQDTTTIDFQWEEMPCDVSSIPKELNLGTCLGWICHIADEKATYFLDETGPCWKFTQQLNRTLSCQKVAELPTHFSRAASFCFCAGSKEQAALFFVTIDPNGGFHLISVSQLESGAWVEKKKEPLATFFPGYTTEPNSYVTGCTVEQYGQQKGCILFPISLFTGPPTQLGCLIFNPTAMSLEKIEVDAPYKQSLVGMTAPYILTSVPVAAGKILLAKGQNRTGPPDTYDLLAFDNGQLKPLREGIPGTPAVQAVHDISQLNRPHWESFRMLAEKKLGVWVSIVSISDNGKRKFFHMNPKHEFQEMANLTGSASSLENKNTLVIPFEDYCYVIGMTPDAAGTEKPVGYRARIKLERPSKK